MTMDKNQEAAMIKTCLLFDEKAQNKREYFFQKRLLADLFCGKYDSVDKAMEYLAEEMPSYAFDKMKVKAALNHLETDGFVVLSEDGGVTLTEKARNKGNESAESQRIGYEQLVEDILRDVELNEKNIRNRQQVKQNIKNCLEYYIQTSSYNLLALDEKVSVADNEALVQKASSNLPQNDRLVSQILLSIGSVIAQPSEAQCKTLETMAQVQITMRLMGVDPMLQNFKRTLIANKVFVLDTDVVLYLITDNGERSRQYKSLLRQLLGCGCNIYIPKELVEEVYNHAEAAKKRYHYVDPVISNDMGKWAEYGIHNVLVESYYRQKIELNKDITWENFIGNYISSDIGPSYTEDVIKEELVKHPNIHYGMFPHNYDIYNSEKQEDIQLREDLCQKALDATLHTEKSEFRNEDKNNSIAKTDTKLFLNIKRLNEMENKRNGNTVSYSKFLDQKYYVLTNTFRIYTCAKDLNIDDRPFCSPSALMAFMVEAGIMNRGQLNVLSLFDNPFLTYIAGQSWNDICKMAQAGIDFKGKNIVRLRYDLKGHLNTLLTATPGTDAYSKAVDDVKRQGYSFKPQIEYARELEKQNTEKEKQIEELQKQIENLKAEKRLENYKARIADKGKKKQKKNKK